MSPFLWCEFGYNIHVILVLLSHITSQTCHSDKSLFSLTVTRIPFCYFWDMAAFSCQKGLFLLDWGSPLLTLLLYPLVLNSSVYFPSGLPWCLSDKESVCQRRKLRFEPWVGQMPWRRKWQPTPVFLPGKSHGQRSLVGYSPGGHKESDTTKQFHFLSE